MIENIKLIEQCGYTVEQSSKLPAEYLTIFKEGKPIGFLLKDSSVTLVEGLDGDMEKLKAIAAFTADCKGLEKTQDGKCVVIRYKTAFMTVVFLPENLKRQYVIYTAGQEEASSTIFYDEETAVNHFLAMMGIADLNSLQSKSHRKEGLVDKAMGWVANQYMKKQANTQG